MVRHPFHQRFQAPKIEVLTYINCTDTAHVRETPTSQNSLIKHSTFIFGTWNFWWPLARSTEISKIQDLRSPHQIHWPQHQKSTRLLGYFAWVHEMVGMGKQLTLGYNKLRPWFKKYRMIKNGSVKNQRWFILWSFWYSHFDTWLFSTQGWFVSFAMVGGSAKVYGYEIS